MHATVLVDGLRYGRRMSDGLWNMTGSEDLRQQRILMIESIDVEYEYHGRTIPKGGLVLRIPSRDRRTIQSPSLEPESSLGQESSS